jgi:hypothetical protein
MGGQTGFYLHSPTPTRGASPRSAIPDVAALRGFVERRKGLKGFEKGLKRV